VKKIFIILAVILMFGCENRTEEQIYREYKAKQEKAKQDSIKEAKFKGFRVIEIDSCEYLIRRMYESRGQFGYGFGLMSHKGNCKFCEERRKQE
jgi:hypothetical protein